MKRKLRSLLLSLLIISGGCLLLALSTSLKLKVEAADGDNTVTLSFISPSSDQAFKNINIEKGDYVNFWGDELKVFPSKGEFYRKSIDYTEDGKILVGWSTEKNGEIIPFELDYYPEKNQSFYPIMRKACRVTFNPGQGAKEYGEAGSVKEYLVPEGGYILLKNSDCYSYSEKSVNRYLSYVSLSYQKDGFMLRGWKQGNVNLENGTMIQITGDTEFTADWAKTCTVTFDPGEGVNREGDPLSATTTQVPEGGYISVSDSGCSVYITNDEEAEEIGYVWLSYTSFYAKEGYLLNGWKMGNGTLIEYKKKIQITGDRTFTADWVKSCTVTFDAGEGAFLDYDDDPISYETIEVPKGGYLIVNSDGEDTRAYSYLTNDEVDMDYEFLYYDKETNLLKGFKSGGDSYKFGQIIRVNGDTTLTADWVKPKYNVTLNLDSDVYGDTSSRHVLNVPEGGYITYGYDEDYRYLCSYLTNQENEMPLDRISMRYYKDGKILKGCKKGTESLNNGQMIPVRENITLNLEWVSKAYTVTFNPGKRARDYDGLMAYSTKVGVPEGGYIKLVNKGRYQYAFIYLKENDGKSWVDSKFMCYYMNDVVLKGWRNGSNRVDYDKLILVTSNMELTADWGDETNYESGNKENQEQKDQGKTSQNNTTAFVGSSKTNQNTLKSSKIKITTKNKTFKASKLKKKAQSFKLKYQKTGNGKVTFKKVSGSKKLSITKDGKIKIKKKTKKGNYKIKVKATIAATSTYKSASTSKTIKVKVVK